VFWNSNRAAGVEVRGTVVNTSYEYANEYRYDWVDVLTYQPWQDANDHNAGFVNWVYCDTTQAT
jgi:hypothetical protein